MINRKRDCLTGKEDLESLYLINEFPMYMGVTEQEIQKDELLDLEFGISKGSGMLQLLKLVPLSQLYGGGVHNSSTGAKWKEHHRRFSDFVKKYEPEDVLEIGGANGILEMYYDSVSAGIEWTIVEPNPNPVKDCHAKFISKFFGEDFTPERKYNTIIHSHLLEHIYNPIQFMEQIAECLKEDGKVIFSIPNLKAYMERKYLNALCFEHTYYISEEYLECLLNMSGFRIVEKEYFYEEHSIFYCTERGQWQGAFRKPAFSDLYNKNKRLMEEYMLYYYKLVEDLNLKLSNERNYVYLFGAHIFSQFLLALGLHADKIKCILDNDKNKQGKRLYGTNLFVESPFILKGKERPVVILKAGSYSEEIKKDILENINKDTVFYE